LISAIESLDACKCVAQFIEKQLTVEQWFVARAARAYVA
jgi:hypothetical protein